MTLMSNNTVAERALYAAAALAQMTPTEAESLFLVCNSNAFNVRTFQLHLRDLAPKMRANPVFMRNQIFSPKPSGDIT